MLPSHSVVSKFRQARGRSLSSLRRLMLAFAVVLGTVGLPVFNLHTPVAVITPTSLAQADCEEYCTEFADLTAKADANRAYDSCMSNGNPPSTCDDLYHSVYNSSFGFWYARCIEANH